MKKRLFILSMMVPWTIVVLTVLFLSPTPSLASAVSTEGTPQPFRLLNVSPVRLPIQNTPLSITSGPDLVIEGVTYSPAQPTVGQSIDITVTIKNQGDAVASGFYTHLYVDPANQPPNATTSHTSRTYWGLPLNPGASFHWVRTGQTFAAEGIHPVYAWVDRDNGVVEVEESNNLIGPVNICIGNNCQQTDSYEPDDLCGQANQIASDGTEQQHNLSPMPDKDWVRFDAIGGITYRIQAIADGVDADLVVELHSTCSSPPSFGSGADIEFTAPADGTFYIKVEHNNIDYGPDTNYRLQVTALNSCNAYYEPNNACLAASQITVNEAAQQHNFCKVGDEDWTTFQTEAGVTYVISATNVGSNADVQLGLLLACTDSSSFGSGQRIEYTAASAGTVYVKTENLDPEKFGSGTDYRLQVSQLHTCSPDSFENDSNPATASLLTVDGAVQSHDFCPSDDVDWTKFDATAGSNYTIETFNLDTEADTLLCIYDENGTQQLACDDDSGEGLGSRISWQAPSNGTFIVRIKNQDPTVAGPSTHYDLRLISGQCVPDNAEPDDSQNTAQQISANGSLNSRNTCFSGDEDWVSFNVDAGSYIIETANLGPESDTLIELYNASGARLAFNDDYGPGEASRIHYVFSNSAVYYLKVRQFNPTQNGTGTEYDIRVKRGTPPTSTPTATPPPTITPTATPPPSSVDTLILVNRERLVTLHGESSTAQLMITLDTLAAHTSVNGEIIRLDLNQTINNAYTTWVNDITNVDKANAVSAAIRSVVMTYLQEHDGVEYIVLIGDDRALPFRRIVDNTPRNDYLERHYLQVDETHSTGSALRNNHYLTDDYYADREPTAFLGRELYLPDLAIGRLVETPDDIRDFIDVFLAGDELAPDRVLVTGYDFVQDTAAENCSDWQAEYGAAGVDCALIGDSWLLNNYRTQQLNANPPFKLQSINGHANHFQEGAPGFGQNINAQEIANSTADLSRGLIYTLGCHSGLNVPPTNTQGPFDLAQAFAQKQANYVGNTGYGWGLRGAVGLSERLMRLYTEELRRDNEVTMGQALATAKRRYFQEGQNFTGYDEKILQESVFYGLPMYGLVTTSVFSTDDPFPSVNVISGLPANTFGDETVISGTVSINLIGSLGAGDVMDPVVTTDGVYYELDGHAMVEADTPIQPLFYANVGVPGWSARSVVFKGGSYETVTNFDPVVAAPVNDYITTTVESEIAQTGWYPSLPLGLQTVDDNSNLVAQLGQFDPIGQQIRLYNALDFDLYYSLSTDQTPPTVTVATALYNSQSKQVNIKVGAVDDAGVARVLANYTDGNGEWHSIDLVFDPITYKWFGDFPGDLNTRYFIQAIDGAGNAAFITNKGLYLMPVPGIKQTETQFVFLPMIVR